MEGLEISEISFLQIQARERIDAEFFKKCYLKKEKVLLSKGSVPLEQIVKLYDGPFGSDFHSSGYVSSGVPILRMQNISSQGVLLLNNLEFITEKDSNKLSKHTVYPGEVVTTKIGFLGFTTVLPDIFPKYVFRRELTRLKILNNSINPYYLSAFFNSHYGREQFYRYASGTSRDRVLLINQKKALVFSPSNNFQNEIARLIKASFTYDEKSNQIYLQAEQFLLRELNLQNFQPSAENISIKTFSESFCQNGRLDAEYYQHKYEELTILLNNYKNGIYDLKAVITTKRGSLIDESYYDYNPINKKAYVRGKDISSNYFDETTVVYTSCSFIPAKETTCHINDIVFTLIGSVGTAAIVTPEFEGAYISNNLGVIRVDVKKINPFYLYLFLTTEKLGKQFFNKIEMRTAQPKISDKDILQIPIPRLDDDKQIIIQKLIQESFDLRNKSKFLLEIAKQAVEIGIEQNEDIAFKFIEDQLTSDGLHV